MARITSGMCARASDAHGILLMVDAVQVKMPAVVYVAHLVHLVLVVLVVLFILCMLLLFMLLILFMLFLLFLLFLFILCMLLLFLFILFILFILLLLLLFILLLLHASVDYSNRMAPITSNSHCMQPAARRTLLSGVPSAVLIIFLSALRRLRPSFSLASPLSCIYMGTAVDCRGTWVPHAAATR